MPSRKSGSSVEEHTERRASLRRLSSIASLQTLFTRRRSHPSGGVTDANSALASSTDNLSLQSTVANAPVPSHSRFASSTGTLHDDHLLPQEQGPYQSNHLRSAEESIASTYICLPDEPVGNLPRSRTFSNLPLPTRIRKPSGLANSSKSHSRLPSIPKASRTRLPTPPASSRRHANSRLPSTGRSTPFVPPWARLQRSDTEPLLEATLLEQPATALPRSTAFKENISLSPIKPLPPMSINEIAGSSLNADVTRLDKLEGLREKAGNGVDDNLCSSVSVPNMKSSKNETPAYTCRSSPAKARDKPAKGLPRGASQPLLTDLSSRRNTHYGEIKQTRLMFARYPPTPSPPKQIMTTGKLDAKPKERSRPTSNSRIAQPMKALRQRIGSNETTSAAQPPKSKKAVFQITIAEPPAYWCGRLSGLADQYRNAELIDHLASGATGKTETDKMHTADATEERLKRALAQLREQCTTPEARESLDLFQRLFAAKMKLPDLMPPEATTTSTTAKKGGWRASWGSAADLLALAAGTGTGTGTGAPTDGAETEKGELRKFSMSEARKVGFMDRLLGRQKKGNLVDGDKI